MWTKSGPGEYRNLANRSSVKQISGKWHVFNSEGEDVAVTPSVAVAKKAAEGLRIPVVIPAVCDACGGAPAGPLGLCGECVRSSAAAMATVIDR